MKDALPSSNTLVYGVLNQDSSKHAASTNAYYKASKDSVDVVCFSFYMNNAVKSKCSDDASETAKFMIDHGNRKSLNTISDHFVSLGKSIGKPAQLIAGAPCTHSPEGTGYGAVDAHVGLLWYADALGRVAKQGVRVFARQTLFGGSYGLLDHKTYMPTPGYWAAVLHSRLMGTSALPSSAWARAAPTTRSSPATAIAAKACRGATACSW